MTVHFSPDGQTLLDVQHRVRSSGKSLMALYGIPMNGSRGAAESAACSPDGKLLAVGLERDGVEVCRKSPRNVTFSST